MELMMTRSRARPGATPFEVDWRSRSDEAMPYDNVTRKHFDSGDYRKSLVPRGRSSTSRRGAERQRRGEPDGRIGIGAPLFEIAHGTSVSRVGAGR